MKNPVMRNLWKRSGAVLGAALVLAVAVGMPAGAAGVITVTPNPVAVSSAQTSANVNVGWSGMPQLQPVYITQCFKSIADATFDPFMSCSNLSEIVLNQSQNATGSGSLPAYSVFRGENPDGDSGWGCFEAGDTPPAGVTKYTDCYIRLTTNANANTADDVEQKITFASSGGGEIPETSTVVLIPLVGVAVVGAAWFALQRRRSAAAV